MTILSSSVPFFSVFIMTLSDFRGFVFFPFFLSVVFGFASAVPGL